MRSLLTLMDTKEETAVERVEYQEKGKEREKKGGNSCEAGRIPGEGRKIKITKREKTAVERVEYQEHQKKLNKKWRKRLWSE
jgi:hypothetical protein